MSVTSQWKLGDPILSPVKEMISLKPEKLDQKLIYKLLIGAIVPRPIAWVSTISQQGIGNLAPFSFFNGVSSKPPALMLAITRKKNGEKKDTLKNIESTREFVVNSVSDWLVGPMNQTSAEYPYGIDEMEKVGLTPLASERVKPPRVLEAAVHFECELYKTLEVGDGTEGSSTIVVGTIVMMHIHQAAYQDGKILLDELKPISRLSGSHYGKTELAYSIPRPGIGN